MQRTIFFISDGTGITAEALGHSLLSQFEGVELREVRMPFVDTTEKSSMPASNADCRRHAAARWCAPHRSDYAGAQGNQHERLQACRCAGAEFLRLSLSRRSRSELGHASQRTWPGAPAAVLPAKTTWRA